MLYLSFIFFTLGPGIQACPWLSDRTVSGIGNAPSNINTVSFKVNVTMFQLILMFFFIKPVTYSLPGIVTTPYPPGTADPSYCLPGTSASLPHSSCLTNSSDVVRIQEMTSSEILAYLDAHNSARNFTDDRDSVTLPSPALVDLQWDSDLAYTAERWAAQCAFEHDSSDARRLDSSFGYVGQNLWATTGTNGFPSDVVASWFSELEFFVSFYLFR